MLTVAPPDRGSEAEHAAYRLISEWDNGTRVLGGVVVFRMQEDPKGHRRQADAVLFVPDGIVVVRIIAPARQRGSVQAHATGAWSIGTEILRMSGGGSNPLPSLRAAAESVAADLRAHGLEPGDVAQLIVVGHGDPVEPADGRLADGVVVCPMTNEGFAVGIRRAAAVAAAGDVRQWTTADVKAGLAALRAPGRTPAVEELNSEGFMYSPYVLRRPDLVAAATAAAAGSDLATNESSVATVSDTDPAAARRAAAVGSAAVGGGRAASPSAPSPTTGSRSTDPQQDQAPPPPPAAGKPEADDVGLAMFGGPAETAAAVAPASGWGEPPVEAWHEPESETRWEDPAPPAGRGRDQRPGADQPGRDEPDRGRTVRILAVVLALLLVVAAVVVGGIMFFGGDDGSDTAGEPSSQAEPSGEPEPSDPPVTEQVGDRSFTLAFERGNETCAANSRGDVETFFVTTDCAALERALYTTDIDGVPVIVAVALVEMADPATAQELKNLIDTPGTGNVNSLLASGVTVPGLPADFEPIGYASELSDSSLVIVETGWFDPATTGDEQAILQLAVEAQQLPPGA